MKTKEEVLKYCRDLLYGSPVNYPIQKGDFEFLSHYIFPLHERFYEKCGGKGIKAIVVRNHPEYKNRCFALVLNDNSIVDISFIECIFKKGLRENIETACFNAVSDSSKEAKGIVKDWIGSLDLGELSVGLYLDHYNTPEVSISDQGVLDNFTKYYYGRVSGEGRI